MIGYFECQADGKEVLHVNSEIGDFVELSLTHNDGLKGSVILSPEQVRVLVETLQRHL